MFFTMIAGAACLLAEECFDGEIVVPADNGSTDFSVLQNSSKCIVLVAFDLLYQNGRDLRKLPLH